MSIIQKCWTFYSFLDRGKCVIHQWMENDVIKLRAIQKLETRFNYLSFTPTWELPYARKLKGHDDLYEIRVLYEKVQLRPLGWFGPLPNEFTLLIGAFEKDWDFVPKNAPEIAIKRRKAIYQTRSLIHEYQTYIPQKKRSHDK